MPSLLHYEIVTDPTSLQPSLPGLPSVGTVYVVVSNTHEHDVTWDSIEVEIPVGTTTQDLTNAPTKVGTDFRENYPPQAEKLDFQWHGQPLRRFRAQASTPQKRLTLPAGGSLVLIVESIRVSEGEGLVLLRIHEIGSRLVNSKTPKQGDCVLTLGVAKQAPKIPHNFRPEEKSLVDVPQVTLNWEGPDHLDYWIRYPDGQLEAVPPPQRSTKKVRQHSYSHPLQRTLTRGTTYTLVAGTTGSTGQTQAGYFLTTTVHARVPEFDQGTRTPWAGGMPGKGRIAFGKDGAQVQDEHTDSGTLWAKEADVTRVKAGTVDADGVNATWVGEHEAGGGWIGFSESGVNVYKDGTAQTWGTVAAHKADLTGVNTSWVQGRDSSTGWIEFPATGLNVFQGSGDRQWGTVAADKADLTGVNTSWVQGRDSSTGWIEFPATGLNVFQGAGSRQWGTVAADKADLNDLVTRQARMSGRLVLQDGVTVHGLLDAQGSINAPGHMGLGELTVHGNVRLKQNLKVEGRFITD
ncbi:hypothetical protein ABZW03_10465 [Kitasatospora sp. NPDC004799]|uniref:hypothetical protein n=1 Tax=Kitasatospora sp. NPDC004799 TaxID=3154460 RepID=UPI0033A6EE90